VLPSALLKKALHPRLRSHPKGAEGRADGVFASFQAKKSKCLELSKGNRLK